MSEGKYLIYEGVIVKNLEQIWSNLWNQYVDIDENDDYEEKLSQDIFRPHIYFQTLKSMNSY